MKKSAPALVLLMFLLVVLSSIPQIGTVKATDTIYIRYDGSVEGTDKIQRVGNVYSFMDNIYDSIIVERENVVIDGAGYQLQGNNSEYGIKLESGGVTIKNAKISNVEYGIYVYLTSHNNIIVDNDVSGNWRGIYVRGTSNNTITGNKITNNGDGIYLSGTDNILRNNQMEDNSYNFGIIPQPHYNDIDTSNTVNGKPIYYWINQHDRTVPLNAGCVILINCTDIEVQNLMLANNKEGIVLVNTENSEIRNCTLSNSKSGIRLRISSDVTITQNVFTENGEGVTVWESTDILVSENQIANNTESGVRLFDSKEHNTITDNHITSCPVGIEFTASSNNNTISENTITNCDQAILFTTSTYNTLRNNRMFNNENYFHIEHGHYTNVSREIAYFINDVDSSNTINGKPMYYWINQQNKTVPSNASYVTLVNCTNITLSNLKDVSGVLVAFTTNSLISQNSIKNSDVGIKIWRGANNRIISNYLNGNEVGLSISFSADNNVYWNNISNNSQGISLSGPSANNIFR
ncbi:MAG: NosD domain-containing protein, partial [Candidatus Bathyarchaeota archaeon]